MNTVQGRKNIFSCYKIAKNLVILSPLGSLEAIMGNRGKQSWLKQQSENIIWIRIKHVS